MELELESILLPGIEDKRPHGNCRSLQRRNRRTSNVHRQATGRKGNQDIPCRNLETAYQTGWFRRCRRRRSSMAERGEERNRNVRFYRSSHSRSMYTSV